MRCWFIIFLCTSTTLVETFLDIRDEDYFGMEADRYDWTKHPCRRFCHAEQPSKTCYYVFVVEKFISMSKACYDCPFNLTDCYRPHCIPADGVPKTLYVANRLMPGPTIEVCLNDTIVVKVRNKMLSDSTVIHWHGIKQVGTPYMDGVAYVNQCPILPGQSFQYSYEASSDGTFFWHAHIGNQRTDGLFGSLIIHPTIEYHAHRKLYDHDIHNILVHDWMHRDGDTEMVMMYQGTSNVRPVTILINGYGVFKEFYKNGTTYYTPYAFFNVTKGKRYLFRLIGAGSEDCAKEVSIENHSMLVIALDSKNIEPVVVDRINLWAGERVDFVLNANQSAKNYWIKVRGFHQCAPSNSTKGIFQGAILHYDSVDLQYPAGPLSYEAPVDNITDDLARILNPYQKGTESQKATDIAIPNLNALDPNDESLTQPVDQQIYIYFDFYPLDNYDFHREGLYGHDQVPKNKRMGTFGLNHISLQLQSFPLLSQPNMIKPHMLCNSTYLPPDPKCTVEMCSCTHVLQVKLNSVVELVFVDEGKYDIINHPFHLHGHFFRVISSVSLEGPVTVDRVKQLDREGKITRRLDHAPIKDTIKAPGAGYTIVRFHANNPGYWFFHCHFEEHMNIGMSLVFKVGEHEDFPPVPNNFPVCGNYVPLVM